MFSDPTSGVKVFFNLAQPSYYLYRLACRLSNLFEHHSPSSPEQEHIFSNCSTILSLYNSSKSQGSRQSSGVELLSYQRLIKKFEIQFDIFSTCREKQLRRDTKKLQRQQSREDRVPTTPILVSLARPSSEEATTPCRGSPERPSWSPVMEQSSTTNSPPVTPESHREECLALVQTSKAMRFLPTGYVPPRRFIEYETSVASSESRWDFLPDSFSNID